jgi:MOSC domain-containing protein YiiM
MADRSRVLAVSQDGSHRFSKLPARSIRLVAGLGVAGDAHAGAMVQHLSRVAVDPSQPNLRQVHLIQAELFDELATKGFLVKPGDLGENLTTRGVDLLTLPTDTLLAIGPQAVVRITGLRNPCAQIERFMPGLLAQVIERRPDGEVVRKCGIMAVVKVSGSISPGDLIAVTFPPPPHRALERV